MAVESIGWISSFVLVLTMSTQVYRQWASGTSEGVSPWLFVGQLMASTGFTVYSVLVGNWVFVLANALMAVNGVAGFGLMLFQRTHSRRAGQ